ncbi:MAG: trigger factor [Acidobacteria bacterium]|nr:MAG: trigger factor [Acidobacteriota bacterium]PYX41901.1 MAG: trigger factor [Acidobacteriota bacterium]
MSPTETKESTKREIAVEVPAQEVQRETEALIQKYQKLARLPGFRKGHVPASIIRQRFSEDIKTEVVEALVPRYFRQEAEKQGLVPVSQPRVTDLHIHDGEPLRFKASFEILPEIKVEGYKDLRADKPVIEVTDEEVQQALNHLQEQQATFDAIEGRTLADGDFAQVSLDGRPKDGEGQPVHMDDVLVEIGGKNTMPEFTEHLRGASAGDEKTFEVKYPEDSNDQRLRGKTFDYTVKVLSLKKKNLPELNDAFAKEMGDFTGIEDVKKRVRENMEAEKKHTAEHEAKDKLVAELVKRNDFEVPEAMVDRQIDVRLERGLRALASQGMRAEDMKKMDLNRLRSGQRDQAVQEVKASLLLDRIADLEKVEVSDEEIDHEIEALALQTKQTSEAVRARLTRDGALDRIRNRIRNEKTLNFLYHQSA